MGFWTWLGSRVAVGGGTPVPSPQQRNPQTAPLLSPRSLLAMPMPMPAVMPAPGVTAMPGVPLAGAAMTPDAWRVLAGAGGAKVAVAGVGSSPAMPMLPLGPPVAPAGALGVYTGTDPFSVFRKLNAPRAQEGNK